MLTPRENSRSFIRGSLQEIVWSNIGECLDVLREIFRVHLSLGTTFLAWPTKGAHCGPTRYLRIEATGSSDARKRRHWTIDARVRRPRESWLRNVAKSNLLRVHSHIERWYFFFSYFFFFFCVFFFPPTISMIHSKVQIIFYDVV